MDDDSKKDNWGEIDPTPPTRRVFRIPPTQEPESESEDLEPPSEAPPPISPVLRSLRREEEQPVPASAEERPNTQRSESKRRDTRYEEPFDRPNAQKLGIIGGKGVGKSYLFQAMVYRCLDSSKSGAMTYYLKGIHLFKAVGEIGSGTDRDLLKTGVAEPVNRDEFVDNYLHWKRLAQTKLAQQEWYRLRLLFRSGLFGTSRSAMDVEFFDASGEGLLVPKLSAEARDLWEKAYLAARVMVFCLPFWAVFPNDQLSNDDLQLRRELIKEFAQVVENYNIIRGNHEPQKPVASILALTMADDRRSGLPTLQKRWLRSYQETPYSYLKQLAKGSGVASYIANARKVSEMLHEEFGEARDARIGKIPQDLDFGRGKPWIIPLSAIDGKHLDDLDTRYKDKPDDPMRQREAENAAPVPVHVELPLLVALCEQENALM